MSPLVERPTEITVSEKFAEIYQDFIQFCESSCEYNGGVKGYSTDFNRSYIEHRNQLDLEPLTAVHVNMLVKMIGRDDAGTRRYSVKVK